MPCYQCGHCGKCDMYSRVLEILCIECGAPIKPGVSHCEQCGADTLKSMKRGMFTKTSNNEEKEPEQ